MYRLLCQLYKNKIIVMILILVCISRSIAVLFLNKGYAGLIDNILSDTYGVIINSAKMLLITGGIQVVIIVFQNHTSSMLSEKVGYTLRTEAIDGILNANYKAIENLSIGESLSKLNTDLSGITAWIKNELSTIISDSIIFTVVLTAMAYTNWRLTVISFCIVPFFSIGSYLLSKPITNAEKNNNKAVLLHNY